MVGFIPKPSIEEEEASKPKNFEDPLDSFDPKLADLSFADTLLDSDSFLDFDSIKEFFDDGPDSGAVYLERRSGLGGFEKMMEVHGGLSEPVVDVSNGGSGCLVKVEQEKLELEKEKNLSCSSIEEELGKVSLIVGDEEDLGTNPVLSYGGVVVREVVSGEDKKGRNCLLVGSNSIVKSEKVSDDAEIGDANLVTESKSLDIQNEKRTNDGVMPGVDESGSDSESDSDSSSSSSSSSASSGSSDKDDDSDEDGEKSSHEEEIEGGVSVGVNKAVNELGELEEGEIRDGSGEDIVSWSEDYEEEGGTDKMVEWSDLEFDEVDEEDTGLIKEPIRSKNELKVLPHIPPVEAILKPHHQMVPVGVVLSILGAQVIVEGLEKHNPLCEGSILWVTEKNSPLGLIDEIFGPVKNPYYLVRYNFESEVPAGIKQGTLISFVPEFANHVLGDKNLYKKGYDASGENDEEVSDAEFSDDEKEAEYKRMQKMSKRGINDQMNGNKKHNKKKVKNKERNWRKNQFSGQQSLVGVDEQLDNQNQPDVCHSGTGQGNGSSSPAILQDFKGGTGIMPPFPPMLQTTDIFLPANVVWPNGLPSQQPCNTVIPAGFPANNAPWHLPNQLQQQPFQNQLQQPFQMPMPHGMIFQQQFNPNSVVAGGQPNFFGGPALSTWPGVVGQSSFNPTLGAPFPVQPLLPAMNSMNVGDQGTMSNGQHLVQNSNLQAPAVVPSNSQAPQQFNMGASSSRGRKPYHQRGCRFAGGRGRQPSK